MLEIRCPDSECDAELNEEKLKDFLPTHLHKKFHRFKRNALIERNPNTRWCSRPGCEKVVEGTKESPKANCECGQTTCVLCGNVWHENKTCEEVKLMPMLWELIVTIRQWMRNIKHLQSKEIYNIVQNARVVLKR